MVNLKVATRGGALPEHRSSGGTEIDAGGAALRRVSLFAACSDEELVSISRKVVLRRHDAQEDLLGYLDESSDVYFVLEGRLRATIYSLEGRETIFRDIDAGEFFGELSAIDGQPRSANVLAVSDCLVATMNGPDFRSLALANSAVGDALLRYLAKQVRHLTDRVFHLSTWTVKFRLYAELLKLGNHVQSSTEQIVIKNFPTHSEIASRISTHREAVSKELSQLSKDGVIKQTGRTMVLLKPEVLESVLD